MSVKLAGNESDSSSLRMCRFWEPHWDMANAELFVEVNYTSGNQQQQKLQDLGKWEGMMACTDRQGGVDDMLRWFACQKNATSCAKDLPINITARDWDLAGIVMILTRVSAPTCKNQSRTRRTAQHIRENGLRISGCRFSFPLKPESSLFFETCVLF